MAHTIFVDLGCCHYILIACDSWKHCMWNRIILKTVIKQWFNCYALICFQLFSFSVLFITAQLCSYKWLIFDKETHITTAGTSVWPWLMMKESSGDCLLQLSNIVALVHPILCVIILHAFACNVTVWCMQCMGVVLFGICLQNLTDSCASLVLDIHLLQLWICCWQWSKHAA